MSVLHKVIILLTLLLSHNIYASEQDLEIKKIENYLNKIITMSADFTQVDPDGNISTGVFYLKRPGKLRWQYNEPNMITIIANGSLITHYDEELDQVSHVSAGDSLLTFLTRPKIQFTKDIAIKKFKKANNLTKITLAKATKEEEGQVTLIFSNNPLTLKKFEMSDSSERISTISFSKIRYDLPLDKKLFISKNASAPRR